MTGIRVVHRLEVTDTCGIVRLVVNLFIVGGTMAERVPVGPATDDGILRLTDAADRNVQRATRDNQA